MRPTALIALLASAAALAACSSPDAPGQARDAAAEAPAAEGRSHAFAIGTFEAIALHDGSLEFPNDAKILGVGQDPAAIAALVAANGASADPLTLDLQPLLVKAEGRVLLFDSGAGGNFGPGTGELGAALKAAGVDPADVTDVFVSHAHGDHMGGLTTAEGKAAFPNAAVHMSAPELASLVALTPEDAATAGLANHAAIIAEVKPRIVPFAPGAEIVPGLVKAVEIKGHTPGHSGYLIGKGADTLLYIGDTAHHSIISVQRPRWTIQFDGDAPTAENSRAALLARSAEAGQRIYGVHFPFPGLGKVERDGEWLRWVAEVKGS